MRKEIKDTLEKIPHLPGVYLFKDSSDKTLYIGKAKVLKKRVSSYFILTHDDRPQIPVMLSKLDHIEWITAENETEALVLEANLVREQQPPYNIELRDDKHYPYVKITVEEVFPRILIARKVERDRSIYFGPFTDAGQIRRSVKALRKLLKIRSCTLKLDEQSEKRECIDYAMNLCSGPCNKRISRARYNDGVDLVIEFFKGKRREIVEKLSTLMMSSSMELRFEQAAVYRDQLRDIKKLILRQGVDLRRPELNCDVFALYTGGKYSVLTTLMVRGGVIINQNNRIIKGDISIDDSPSMLILDYYSKSADEPPDEIVISSSFLGDKEIIADWFRRDFGGTVTFPKKGDKSQLVDRAEKSGMLFLSQKYLTNGPELLEELAKFCNLPRIPKTIEAFDISNLGATFTVAGMVHFEDGSPVKSRYRRFKIKGVEGQNDFAMMMEAVSRRLTRLENENRPFPDLLLIDGGKGQLSSATQAISVFKNPPMIISLAKKEELIFSSYTADPVQLGEGAPVRRLVERIRDEVHNFAITYHRKIRGRQFNKSILEDIPGIGPKKVKLLLSNFKSAEEVSKQSVDSLSKIKGISLKDSEAIISELKNIF